MTALILIAGYLGVVSVTTFALDPETARLLNTVVNFATLALLYWHRRDFTRDVKPDLKQVQAQVEHLDNSLGQSVPGGQRQYDPPEHDAPPIQHRRRKTDHIPQRIDQD